ncbi:MAG: adenylate/guanylate cyclase domain-containing protein [Kiloniellales bacterium]
MKVRLLAIMLTDMSGYTAFMSKARRDEIDAAINEQQTVIAPLIERYHGRLVKWIGDAALAVFDSAADAVLCGHAVQLAYVDRADQGPHTLGGQVKAVVHVGDVGVDDGGDIYGDPVNVTARMEKLAQPGEVYFSDMVRGAVSPAEIPSEVVGTYEFKGVPGKVLVHRTCFGATPVARERIAIVYTDFVGLNGLADAHGWDVVQPLVDEVVGEILKVTRDLGGARRWISGGRCLLSFESIIAALDAAVAWRGAIAEIGARKLGETELSVRVSMHWGTLHMMRNTIMGRDMHVVETLGPLGFGNEILLTEEARDALLAEGHQGVTPMPVSPSELRDCSTQVRWGHRYAERKIYRMSYPKEA